MPESSLQTHVSGSKMGGLAAFANGKQVVKPLLYQKENCEPLEIQVVNSTKTFHLLAVD